MCACHAAGTKFRQMLRAGEEIPEWFAFKSVVRVLREEIQAEEAAQSTGAMGSM